jgi:hypothetical protein
MSPRYFGKMAYAAASKILIHQVTGPLFYVTAMLLFVGLNTPSKKEPRQKDTDHLILRGLKIIMSS